ncbi:hypothetical protein [Gandjariella thermophila]|uniref:Uncharacterized protein n=1 Tax=Gandjariella thermophila TaxID=1931992 RepID=A0A4D4J1G4_9PSEU|nr:hypothetical protein [Gandjariella thermophila]GDY28912.1 hypothetical protein GTS_05450 [Gandjariella thermophila]
MGAETLPDLKGEAPPSSWTSNFDGSGIVSDIANTTKSIEDGDGLGVGMNGVAVAFDALSLAEDPLGGLLAAGVGWLIEHLSFLRKPLDILAGDPGAVQAQANTWTNIGAELKKCAEDYENSLKSDIPRWEGQAAESYRKQGEELIKEIGGFAEAASGVAGGITIAGVLVGTERGIIRDLISTFIGKMIERALIAAAGAIETLGGSVAAFIADAVAEGSILAGRCASRIAKVLEKLGTLLGKLSKLGHGVGELAAKLSRFAKVTGVKVDQFAGRAGRFAGRVKGGREGWIHAGDDLSHSLGSKIKNAVPKEVREHAEDPWGEYMKWAAKDGLNEQFNMHGTGDHLPPAGGVELGRQGHEAVEKNKEGHEQAEKRVEGPKSGAHAE